MPTTPLGIARTVGKVILAIALAYAALILASLAGGRLASALGVIFHLSSVTIAALK